MCSNLNFFIHLNTDIMLGDFFLSIQVCFQCKDELLFCSILTVCLLILVVQKCFNLYAVKPASLFFVTSINLYLLPTKLQKFLWCLVYMFVSGRILLYLTICYTWDDSLQYFLQLLIKILYSLIASIVLGTYIGSH